ncbi:hypothetical protein JTB14_027000 [Gonioctena quinquepunctata]|nr:hypothetical protein JTB14_027000 [Gonioctena quinquepunctata]
MGSDKQKTDANFTKPTDLRIYLKKLIRDKWERDFPTINTHLNTIKHNVRRCKPPLKLSRKNRIKIQRLGIGNLQLPDTDVNEVTELLASAGISVPRSSGYNGTKSTPWWDEIVANHVADENHTVTTLKRPLTLKNTIAFKRLRAKATRTIRESRRATWKTYVCLHNDI